MLYYAMSASRRRLLRFAEYAAVSASVVGAIASLTTQQPAYAIAPLAIAATLNLVSRQQSSQRLDPKIQQAHQRLDAVDQQGLGYQQKLRDLTETVTQQGQDVAATTQAGQTVQRALAQQNQQLSTLASVTSLHTLASDLQQAKSQISTNIQELQTTLNTLSTRTETLLQQQSEQQKIRFAQAQLSEAQQTALTERMEQLEKHIMGLHSDFDRFRRELEALTHRFDEQSANQEVDLELADNELTSSQPDFSPDFSHVVPYLPAEDNFDLDINLGIDFGTGYTKVCFRDLARDRSEVVTFASPTQTKLSLDQTLIPTRLAILQDGTLLTGLTTAEWQASNPSVRQEINYIKMRLAAIDFRRDDGEDEWRLEQIPELDDDTTVESLCAYYLSSVIRRSQQWITQNRPELFTNQTVRWSVNLGVPVEYCDSPALKRFERVLALAWLLKSTSVDTSALTIDALNRLISHLQQWMDSNTTMAALDCSTTPEIAAAVWSFINSRQAQEGFYTFFDIGDGTLDGAAFIFQQAEGDRTVDFYIGQVEPLGVTAFVEKTAAELGTSPDNIRQSLNAQSDQSNSHLHNQMQQSSTRKKVQRMVAKVVMEGNEKHHQVRQYSAGQDIGSKLKVFVGGGGGNTAFFPNAISATHGDFNQGNADIPPYEIRQIPTPDDLSINGLDSKDFNRFAIAYGLCIPEGEGPTVQLPSKFSNVEPATDTKIYQTERYEDSRDAT